MSLASRVSIPILPLQLFLNPNGSYSIFYEFKTASSENKLPNHQEFNQGEHCCHSELINYTKEHAGIFDEALKRKGYLKQRYSGYCNPQTTAIDAWLTVQELFQYLPPTQFESTTVSFRMQYNDPMGLLVISEDMAFGRHEEQHFEDLRQYPST